jgi:2-dehydropantoate 2-reductase
MKILCLGAGAIGGYFAGRLVEADAADVTFLVREGRRTQLARDGLRVESRYGNFTVPVKTCADGEIKEHADFVLLTCKAYDLDSAIASIRPAVGPETAIIPLLNGMAHMDTLNAAFGQNRVLGGIAKIGITLQADGVIKHLNDWRYITFGEQDRTISKRALALKAAFDKTSVVAEAVPNITHQMWEKLVHLSSLAAMTTLMRANVGEIARAPGGSVLMQDMLNRNAAIAAKVGYPPTPAFMANFTTLFADTTATYTASMLRDMERGGPVEADHIVGYMLALAEKHGLDPMLHRITYANLKAYEQRRAAGRL